MKDYLIEIISKLIKKYCLNLCFSSAMLVSLAVVIINNGINLLMVIVIAFEVATVSLISYYKRHR